MFLALSQQIYHQLDLEVNALEVRDMVVDHLQKNPRTIDGTHLRNFVPEKKEWNTYLDEMLQKGTWGDNLMLMGAADVLEVTIKVISTWSDEPIVIKPREKKASLRTLCLGHLAEFHYVSLEKKDQKCRTCHQTLSVCRCAVSINADASDNDDSCRSPSLSSGDESDNDGSPRVTADFFENKKPEVCCYIKSLLQGRFSEDKEGRGERHNWFVTKYPYHEVKAGFGSDFVSAEMYGHILQWLGQSLTRRLVRDKRRPYTKSVTQIFTVPDVDANLRELPMEYTQAAWHYILYVAIKEVIVFLAEKLTGRTYSSINPECQRTELHPKEL
ncbi:uncharacterized protein LOC124135411 [Haliotis rufescens]|uniref:uncharacterized protein LOC124135411 n=1 Tax=Haliotis rufescens TaxID=6454 RepID=UPI00201F7940|nr:uncharacterized protein LOC124135411 [Haliotis rufescens]